MIAGIETGGTKVVCGVVRRERPTELLAVRRIPTTTPDETLAAVNAFLDEVGAEEPVEALGIASFGPVNVEPDRPRYGWVTGTPKLGWVDTDVLGRIPLASSVPSVFLADVGAAAVGEHRWGAAAGTRSAAYATVGTGIGVGLVVHGALLHGNGYPELGHLLVRRHPLDDFPGNCRFHGDCLEGLAAGPAVTERWGSDSSSLPADVRSTAHEILGFYLAQVVLTTGIACGIERMVLGGGVMQAQGVLDQVRRQLPLITGGPGAGNALPGDAAAFVVPPALEHSGLFGAIAAAGDALGAP
jgi:fructokinase